MARLIVLGNCVAERLGLLLEGLLNEQERCCPGLGAKWRVEQATPVYNLPQAEIGPLARKALECDLVFTQPIFNYGPCNTDALREKLGPRLRTFSAPNFEAYFPDVMDIRPYPEPEKFPPPMEWHSKIVVQCREAGASPEEVANIYVHHPLFRPASIKNAIERSLEIYARRDQNVEIGSMEFVRDNFAAEPLFYTWNHPADPLLRHLLLGMLRHLGLDGRRAQDALGYIPWGKNFPSGWAPWGFGFNAWPIITRWHGLFNFPGREWFRVKGEEVPIANAVWSWYRYYDAHPQIFAKALDAARRL